MSITDAKILVRNGEQFETASFLDSQTKSVTVMMVAFSPEYGLASTIKIMASMEADVSVDFAVEHFASLEGDDLDSYTTICIVGFVLAGVITIEKIVTVLGKDFKEVRFGFVCDMVVQVALPVLYFAIRLVQVIASREAISKTVGVDGLSGVPWASRSVSLENQIDRFRIGLDKFHEKLVSENVMSVFYFVHATSSLLRLIFQTSAHPRTAMLVNTIYMAAADLWHWIILFILVNFSFVLLGMAQFASELDEFSSFSTTFELLWEMLLGAMLGASECVCVRVQRVGMGKV
jgi:hypothetical protein